MRLATAGSTTPLQTVHRFSENYIAAKSLGRAITLQKGNKKGVHDEALQKLLSWQVVYVVCMHHACNKPHPLDPTNNGHNCHADIGDLARRVKSGTSHKLF
jgi:hypothetical protein